MPAPRSEILVNRLKTIPAPVAGWPADLHARELNGRQRFELAKMYQAENPDYPAVQAWAIAQSFVDAEGNRVFLADDVEALIETNSPATLDEAFGYVQKVSGLGGDAVEDAAKN